MHSLPMGIITTMYESIGKLYYENCSESTAFAAGMLDKKTEVQMC